MKTLTLEQAEFYLGDDQAISRGYLSPQVLRDAERLASAVAALPTFGQQGYLAPIGSPHQWWEENCSVYAELASAPYYGKAKRFNYLLSLAQEMIADDLAEAKNGNYQY